MMMNNDDANNDNDNDDNDNNNKNNNNNNENDNDNNNNKNNDYDNTGGPKKMEVQQINFTEKSLFAVKPKSEPSLRWQVVHPRGPKHRVLSLEHSSWYAYGNLSNPFFKKDKLEKLEKKWHRRRVFHNLLNSLTPTP